MAEQQNQTPSDDDEPTAEEVDRELESILERTRLITYQDYRDKLNEHPDLTESDSLRARMVRLLGKTMKWRDK